MQEKPPSKTEDTNYVGLGIALGAGVGVALGAAFNNLAMGVALGAGLGVVLGAVLYSQKKK